jgi:hypothetical protein
VTPRAQDCVPIEELGAVLESPAGDPRRAHVESCARCSALAQSYARFLAGESAGEDLYGDVEARALDLHRAHLATDAPVETAPPPGRLPARPRRLEGWFAPSLRPAWALATAAVLVAAVVLAPRLPWPGTGSDVRGGRAEGFRVRSSTTLPDGGLEIGWSAAPEAERYEVRLYAPTLAEMARYTAGRDTGLRIGTDALPAGLARGGTVLVRVVALRGGDEVDSTQARPVTPR